MHDMMEDLIQWKTCDTKEDTYDIKGRLTIYWRTEVKQSMLEGAPQNPQSPD